MVQRRLKPYYNLRQYIIVNGPEIRSDIARGELTSLDHPRNVVQRLGLCFGDLERVNLAVGRGDEHGISQHGGGAANAPTGLIAPDRLSG